MKVCKYRICNGHVLATKFVNEHPEITVINFTEIRSLNDTTSWITVWYYTLETKSL